MSSIPPIITVPPVKPKSGNKFRRWLGTSTAKGAIVFAAAGVSAIVSPDVGQAITDAADGLSKGDVAGITASVITGVLGYLRSRSA